MIFEAMLKSEIGLYATMRIRIPPNSAYWNEVEHVVVGFQLHD